jgi:hypothetical protein
MVEKGVGRLFGEGGGGLDPTGEWEVLEMLKNTKIRKS